MPEAELRLSEAGAAVEAPDASAMERWLRDEAIAADGCVWSWVNATHPGYAYPEAAGLVLQWLVLAGDMAPARNVAQRIAREPTIRGGVGRGGREYAFDTAMALGGLLAYGDASGDGRHHGAVDRMLGFVVDCIEARCAVLPPAPARWSTRWAPHQLKLAWVMRRCSRHLGRARTDALLERLAEGSMVSHDGKRFLEHAGSAATYLHAACYAAEGLLCLVRHGRVDLWPALEQTTAWLAQLQRDDGSLPVRWDARGPSEEAPRTDVVAQALRLWQVTGRERYRSAIRRGRRFLAALQSPSGGLRYAVDRHDVNTWATVFALQAERWVARGDGGEAVI